MIEILLVAGLIRLWQQPRWALLNKIGILVMLLMAPGAALVWQFAPDSFRGLLYWWAAYLAMLLVFGSFIITSRIKGDAVLSERSRGPSEPWAPRLSKLFGRFGKSTVALIAISVALSVVVALTRHTTFVASLTMAAMFNSIWLVLGYLWFATMIADVFTTSKST